MSDWVEGRISRVVYASAATGYAVLALDTSQGPVMAVGELGSLAEGDADGGFVALEGRWEHHPVHGKQLRATGLLQGTPRTLEGLRLYLSSSQLPGIGPKLAGRIVDTFGVSALHVLTHEPHRLTLVEGIGPKRAREIAARWQIDEAGRALAITLRGLGLGNRLIDRIRRRYGDRAGEVVRREPYRLAEDIAGIGFLTADRLAREQGAAEDDPGRVRAAILHALDEAADEGHCFLAEHELHRHLEDLRVPTAGAAAAIASLADEGRIVRRRDTLMGRGLDRAEDRVARGLRARLGEDSREAAREEAVRAAAALSLDLDPLQLDAVSLALGGGVVVITGGPGTGKTTLVRALMRALEARGERWALASPTGRAARRLEEATGHEAKTLHRLLEFNPGQGGFQRGIGRAIEAQGLLVDEVSMVDLPLMAALIEALPPEDERFTLVLVGDADQLPSVGPGAVLRDLLASGVVPHVRLQRVFRQGARSGIVTAAGDILAGRVPDSGERIGVDDFFVLPRTPADRAVETLLTVVAERLPGLGFAGVGEVQVLAPARRGPLGTIALNEALQARLNPDGEDVGRRGRSLRVGDRVLCVKNRYDVEVFNGDVGVVTGRDGQGLRVRFDEREVEWLWEDLDLLELAYAMTVHKSQGSEYGAVVLALHPANGPLLRRNLVYTAVTRARRFLCVVGDPASLERAIASGAAERRNTFLAERLRELEDEDAPPEGWLPGFGGP